MQGTGTTIWSSTTTVVMGAQSSPSGVTYTSTLTPTTSGITCVVTPTGVPTNIHNYDAVWSTSSSTPVASTTPNWSGTPDSTGVLHFFAGGNPGTTLYIFIRAVNSGGLKQSWSSLGNGVVLDPAATVQQSSYAADTGTANAYAVTLSPAPTIIAGSPITFKAANANTGASTLAVNGGSPTAIKKNGSTSLSAGDISAGQIVTVVYDGTVWQMQGVALAIGKKEIPSAIAGAPPASMNVMIYTATSPLTFPGNFATTPGPCGSVGTNPTATATYTVKKNGSSVGTITISTSGVFTFATTSGTAINLVANDRFTVTAPSTVDTTLADVGFTLVGTY
jgi:hypothetical protein